jgi:hypothetical protein
MLQTVIIFLIKLEKYRVSQMLKSKITENKSSTQRGQAPLCHISSLSLG